MHRRVDARYQACIKGLVYRILGVQMDSTNALHHSISMADARDNLYMMRGKTRNIQIPDECGTVA